MRLHALYLRRMTYWPMSPQQPRLSGSKRTKTDIMCACAFAVFDRVRFPIGNSNGWLVYADYSCVRSVTTTPADQWNGWSTFIQRGGLE